MPGAKKSFGFSVHIIHIMMAKCISMRTLVGHGGELFAKGRMVLGLVPHGDVVMVVPDSHSKAVKNLTMHSAT